MRSSRNLIPLLVALGLVAAACGGSSDPVIQAAVTTSTSSTTTTIAPVEIETVPIDELTVGFCSNSADIDTARGQLAVVDCAEPHRYEVFAAAPASAIIVGEEGVAEATQSTCEQIAQLRTGVRPDGWLIQVIGIALPGNGGGVCLYEAPDQRVDFFARVPVALPSVQVTRSLLDGPATDSFAAPDAVTSDGESVVVAVGRTDRTDPDNLDAIIWRSTNGGASFTVVDDGTLRTNTNAEVPEAIVTVLGGYLAIGTRYGDVDPQPWAVVADFGALNWSSLAVPLGDAAGAELRFAVTRADGTIDIAGSLYDRRGLRRPAVWTWDGLSLGAPQLLVPVEAQERANYFVEAAFADETGMTVLVTDLFANVRRGFISSAPGAEWTAFSQADTLQFSTTVVADGTFAIRAGGLSRQDTPGGPWARVELPGHDGARPNAVAITSDGDDLMVVGTMASVEGDTTAFWRRPDGGEFELIYFDIDQASRDDRPQAITRIEGGYLVVGVEDPELDGAEAGVAWTIDLP